MEKQIAEWTEIIIQLNASLVRVQSKNSEVDSPHFTIYTQATLQDDRRSYI